MLTSQWIGLALPITDALAQTRDVLVWIRPDDVKVFPDNRREMPSRFLEEVSNSIRVLDHMNLGVRSDPNLRPLSEELMSETISLRDSLTELCFQTRIIHKCSEC